MEQFDTDAPEDQANGDETPQAAGREIAIAFAAIAIAGILFAVPSFPEPFGVDQGIYGYIAERLLEGAVDHRDVFDHKPPGIHFAYAAAFKVFGHAMRSVWILDLVVVILTGWGMYVLGRQWKIAKAGLIAGFLYVAYYQGFFNNMSRGQPESWVNLAFVAGLLLTASARGRAGLIGAGAALCAGLWFKPTICLPALLCIGVLADRAVRESNGGWRRFGLDLAAVVGGALAMSALVFVYYIAHGALDDLYEAVWVFNRRFHGDLDLVRGWKQLWQACRYIIEPLYALSVLSLAAASIVVLPGRRRVAIWVGAWLALAAATVFWQGSFQKAHYALVLAPLVFLAALGVEGLYEAARANLREDSNRRAALMAIGAAAFLLVLLNLRGLLEDRVVKFSALASGRLSRQQYHSTFSLKGIPGQGGYSFEDVRKIGAYIEGNTSPDDPIYVWGFRPIIAYLARRRMPTRFCFRYPLTRTHHAHWWREFLGDLDRSPPVFFVVVTRDRGLYHPETSKEALENNHALKSFLEDRYEFDRTLSDFNLYRLRQNDDRTSAP